MIDQENSGASAANRPVGEDRMAMGGPSSDGPAAPPRQLHGRGASARRHSARLGIPGFVLIMVAIVLGAIAFNIVAAYAFAWTIFRSVFG